MKQVLQNLSSGLTTIEEVPCPNFKKGNVLIKTNKSLVSAGTERMLIDFGKSGWLNKARSQPEKVKEVLEKIQTDGFSATFDAIKSKLDLPLPLGYCNVGVVENGTDTGFEEGLRVVSNGNHAEMVRVPKNLVARIPDEVDDESAVFTVMGAVALQGIRLASPKIGELVVVTGLGLIGLLAVQILKANGCQVLAIDLDSKKCALAKQFGAEVVDLSKEEDALLAAEKFSAGRGVDSVLITASSESNDIVHQAATMCRKRGKIVLIGVVGLELNRSDFYEKELSFQVSCSYGPGRYDDEYENKGNDYPYAFVRWTEQRNFEAILGLMANGSIDTKPLISHNFSLDNAGAAYEALDNSSLGIVLNYLEEEINQPLLQTVKLEEAKKLSTNGGNIAFIGAGNYASRILIPSFKKSGANLISLVTSGGLSAKHFGKKNNFKIVSTDIQEALGEDIDLVVIATQHNLHASQALQAIKKNKHIFVEKPLALTGKEIDDIESALKISGTKIMVGYNRRFSPHALKIKELLDKKQGPKSFIVTVNAGEISTNHWTQDPEVGGGRIIGEACHHVDLLRFLANSKIKSFSANKMGPNRYIPFTEDKSIITLIFEDGSIGSIHYFANGGKSFPKERIEVFCDNSTIQLDNFKKMSGFGWKGFKKMNLWRQNKGQLLCAKAFMDAILKNEESPIPLDEILEVARVSVQIAETLRK